MKRKILFIIAVLLFLLNGCGNPNTQANRNNAQTSQNSDVETAKNVELESSKMEKIIYIYKNFVPVSSECLIAVSPWFDHMEVIDGWRIECYKGSIFLIYDPVDKEWKHLFDVETEYNAFVEDVLYDQADESFYLKCSIIPMKAASLPEEYLIQKVSSKGVLEWEAPLGKQDSVEMFLDEDRQNLILFGHSEGKDEIICIACESGSVEKKELQKSSGKNGNMAPFFFCTQTDKSSSVYCLDQNGGLIWKTDLEFPDYQYTASTGKDLFVVSQYSSEMLQLSAETGALVQKIPLPKGRHQGIYSPPIAIDEHIFLIFTSVTGSSPKSNIIQYDTNTKGSADVIETIDGYYWFSLNRLDDLGIVFLESMEDEDTLVYTISTKNG